MNLQQKNLSQKVEEFAYVDYNHVRPHSFNGYRTPYKAREYENFSVNKY